MDEFWGAALTLDDIHREAGQRGFFVRAAHIASGLLHRLDHLVERDAVLGLVFHRDPRRVNRLHRPDGVALDAWNLHQAADRIAGHPEMMLDADLGGMLDLGITAALGRDETG